MLARRLRSLRKVLGFLISTAVGWANAMLARLGQVVRLSFLRARSAALPAYDEHGIRLPSPHLVLLVTGNTDVGWFLASGKLAAQSLRDILRKNNIDIGSFEAILDFGCGVGRVLRHLRVLTGARLFGCDYNGNLIAWCRINLSFADFSINQLDGKLLYDRHSFDFIYALSVFTHLTEAQNIFWINELMRVLRPGGYLLLTTHGKYYEQQIPKDLVGRFSDGDLVVVNPGREGQNTCGAYHPEKYVRDELARGWEVIDFVERGALGNPYQDVYLLRSPAASG
jgi:SAM-dependent methyltransferase